MIYKTKIIYRSQLGDKKCRQEIKMKSLGIKDLQNGNLRKEGTAIRVKEMATEVKSKGRKWDEKYWA